MSAVMLFLLIAVAETGDSPPLGTEVEILAEAETAFRTGIDAGSDPVSLQHFKKAAQLYTDLETRGSRNADLYRNLGNARFLYGDLPGAILAYRLGLELDPGDPVLQENLNIAREQVAYPEAGVFARPPVEHWPPWLPRPSVTVLFMALFALYTLALYGWLRWRITQHDSLLGIAVTASLLAVAVAGLTFFEARRQAERDQHRLVVIAENDLMLRRGDAADYPANYPTPLNRGVEARLLFDGGNWLQIQLTGGEVGWVPRASTVVESPAS
ncbi:MAG: hypothetical protein AB7K24_12530 [Gemmataceae bacterium]